MLPEDPIADELEKRMKAGGPLRDVLKWAESAYDKEMNRAYRAALAALPASQRALLQASQREWVQFRDREFALMNSLFSSLRQTISLDTPEQLAWLQDRVNLVKERALNLRKYKTNPYRIG